MIRADAGRAYCYACMKPEVTCVCARVPRVDNRTFVWLVQHPRERRHPIGTARLLELGLARFRLDVAFLRGPRLAPGALPPRTALLYPSPTARALDELTVAERPEHLVVLDGTWHHAHSLARDLEWLDELPRVKLGEVAPSRYRIRKEPRAECVSTIEAVVAALSVLEPETPGLDALLAAFDSMIDDQLAFVKRRAGPRRAKRRRPGLRGMARALVERYDDLVIAYAETAPGSGGERALVQLAAVRARGGPPFDCVLRGPLPSGLVHMRLSPDDLEQGARSDELACAWRSFLGPRDLVVVWNQSTLDVLEASGLTERGLSLKAVWANAVERAPGTLDGVVARAGLWPERVPVRGRASERLGHALAVAEALCRRAESAAESCA